MWSGFTPSICQETRRAATLPKQHTTKDTITLGKAPLWSPHLWLSFKEEVPVFHLLNTCWGLCAEHMVRLRRHEKEKKGLSGSFQCYRPNYSLRIPRGPILVQEGGNSLPVPQAQALQEFLETNFSWDVIQICTLSLCPRPFLFLKGSKSKTQGFKEFHNWEEDSHGKKQLSHKSWCGKSQAAWEWGGSGN